MKNKKGKLFSFKYFLQDFIKITGAIPYLIAFRPKVIYASKAAKKKIKGGAILASNHVGFCDALNLMSAVWYRRHHFVVLSEVFEHKFARFWFSTAFLCLPIDRGKPDIVNVRSIITHLKNEELVTIFPEGHINEGGNDADLQDFKSGMALMAVMSGKPIVPIYIKKRKNIFQRQRMALGEPIYVDEEERRKAPLEYMDKLSRLVYEKEKELQEIFNRRKK